MEEGGGWLGTATQDLGGRPLRNMRLGILTTGRQDWSILRSTCELVRSDPRFELILVAGGMHCSDRFGRTIRLVEEAGFEVAEALPWITDESDVVAESARAMVELGKALKKTRPDCLLLVGDRYETAAAAVAATLSLVPLVHLHGGEETAAAFDNALRHAITKLSHLHLVSHSEYARRVVAMGEDSTCVRVVGAPGLDNLFRHDLADRAELEKTLGLALEYPVVVVTVHPTTLATDSMAEVTAVCSAMDAIPARYVITLPNADPGHEPIRDQLRAAASKPGRVAVDALGGRRYWGLLRLAAAVLGNSSSGVIEAPAIGLPSVNVGSRQKGRLRSNTIIDVAAVGDAVVQGLRRALARGHATPESGAVFSADGKACQRIRDALLAWEIPRPPAKRSPWSA
ncbi:MAG: UDP-N-acetylglucosamine 2-epimerase [Polyangiaceae bacterium]